jgi:molecular chaperone GrpE
VTESAGKPEKISLDEILREGGGPPPGADEDGIIEVVAGSEPCADEERAPAAEAEGPAEAPAGPAGPAGADPAAAQLEDLLTDALREKDHYHELLLRARADLENFRKRVERDRDEDRVRAAGAVVSEILPVLDNLDRALAQPPEAPGLREGVVLIRRQLEEAIRRMGAEPIEAIGEPFDPSYHEALAAEAREGLAPNTIIEEIRKGWILGGRVLRPSMVRVVQAPAPKGAGGDDGADHRD